MVDQNDTKLSHRQTPFAPVYGAEAVLPMELIYGSPRVLAYDELEQEKLRQDDTMLLEEDHLRVAVRAARYQQALRRYHSHKVHARSFEEGDVVLWTFSRPRIPTS